VAASDSYGVVDASSDSWPAAASEDSFALASSQSFEPSSYSAVSSEPVITDNSVAAAGDSYGSPRAPAPSSYDAPAVPSLAGYTGSRRRRYGSYLPGHSRQRYSRDWDWGWLQRLRTY